MFNAKEELDLLDEFCYQSDYISYVLDLDAFKDIKDDSIPYEYTPYKQRIYESKYKHNIKFHKNFNYLTEDYFKLEFIKNVSFLNFILKQTNGFSYQLKIFPSLEPGFIKTKDWKNLVKLKESMLKDILKSDSAEENQKKPISSIVSSIFKISVFSEMYLTFHRKEIDYQLYKSKEYLNKNNMLDKAYSKSNYYFSTEKMFDEISKLNNSFFLNMETQVNEGAYNNEEFNELSKLNNERKIQVYKGGDNYKESEIDTIYKESIKQLISNLEDKDNIRDREKIANNSFYIKEPNKLKGDDYYLKKIYRLLTYPGLEDHLGKLYDNLDELQQEGKSNKEIYKKIKSNSHILLSQEQEKNEYLGDFKNSLKNIYKAIDYKKETSITFAEEAYNNEKSFFEFVNPEYKTFSTTYVNKRESQLFTSNLNKSLDKMSNLNQGQQQSKLYNPQEDKSGYIQQQSKLYNKPQENKSRYIQQQQQLGSKFYNESLKDESGYIQHINYNNIDFKLNRK